MIDPMLVPAMAWTGIRSRSITRRTPMCAAPRAPPPDRASPMRGRLFGVSGEAPGSSAGAGHEEIKRAAAARARRARLMCRDLIPGPRLSCPPGGPSPPLSRLLDLYRHRALIGVLTSRELKARYRGSVLGFFWSLLNPLLMLAVYALVFEVLLPNRSAGTSPYALFLFTGLLPWNWLASSLTDAASSLLVSGPLLKKILFPAEVLPVVAVASQAVHFLLALPILLAGLVGGALGLFGPKVALGWPLVQAKTRRVKR